ncbi:MAG: NAD(P)H-dependent oxidoreductase [Boseongicola sp.]
MTNILRIDASARRNGSVSRDLTGRIVDRFGANDTLNVATRDLADPLPLIDENWVNANFTAPNERSAEQTQRLSLSDNLVAELQVADVLVIGLPVYNFSVPAAFKAWIDLVARVGVTFRYTENGPEGLLGGKRAIIAVASGGTEIGSEYDFATGYVRHVLGFLGIRDVVFVAADQLAVDAEIALKNAYEAIETLEMAA